jgi:hypothetical protein
MGVRFAVLETQPSPVGAGPEAALELVLANGERLRIARGVDAATLRLTLDAIRHDPPAGERARVPVPGSL